MSSVQPRTSQSSSPIRPVGSLRSTWKGKGTRVLTAPVTRRGSDPRSEPFDGPLLHDPSAVDHGHVVADSLQFVHQVAAENDRGAGIGHVVDDGFVQVTPNDGIETVRGLVQNEEIGPLSDGLEDEELAHLPLGEGPDGLVLLKGESLEEILGHAPVPAGVEAPVHRHGLTHRQVSVQVGPLGHVPRPSKYRREVVRDRMPQHGDLPGPSG